MSSKTRPVRKQKEHISLHSPNVQYMFLFCLLKTFIIRSHRLYASLLQIFMSMTMCLGRPISTKTLFTSLTSMLRNCSSLLPMRSRMAFTWVKLQGRNEKAFASVLFHQRNELRSFDNESQLHQTLMPHVYGLGSKVCAMEEKQLSLLISMLIFCQATKRMEASHFVRPRMTQQ